MRPLTLGLTLNVLVGYLQKNNEAVVGNLHFTVVSFYKYFFFRYMNNFFFEFVFTESTFIITSMVSVLVSKRHYPVGNLSDSNRRWSSTTSFPDYKTQHTPHEHHIVLFLSRQRNNNLRCRGLRSAPCGGTSVGATVAEWTGVAGDSYVRSVVVTKVTAFSFVTHSL